MDKAQIIPPIKINAVVQPEGTLVLEHLPFPAGLAVEIAIAPRAGTSNSTGNHNLQGTIPYRYDDPFEPAAPNEDWEALR